MAKSLRTAAAAEVESLRTAAAKVVDGVGNPTAEWSGHGQVAAVNRCPGFPFSGWSKKRTVSSSAIAMNRARNKIRLTNAAKGRGIARVIVSILLGDQS